MPCFASANSSENHFQKPDFSSWIQKIKDWKEKHPLKYDKGKHLTSQEAIDVLYEESKGEAIITTELGSIRWAAQYYKFNEPRLYIFPRARNDGVWLSRGSWSQSARPDKEVIDIDGDGSFIMNVQELATAKIEN